MTMYSLSDFTDISNKGFHVILPDSTVQLINELSKLVGSPNYIKTPVFTKRVSTVDIDKKRRRQHNRQTDDTNGWSSGTNSTGGFKKVSAESNIGANIVFNPAGSLIKKDGEGATPIQLIRPLLNKFGGKVANEAIKNELFTTINEIFESDITQEDLSRLMNQIINIVSGNQFYSSIYANLFSEMIDAHSSFTTTLEKQFSNYISNYTDIQSIDPSEDYDSFCIMNKKNDNRKAITSFYIHLYKLDKISQSSMMETIKTLSEMIRDNINDVNMIQLITEIVENLFIFMDTSTDLHIRCNEVTINITDDTELSICQYIRNLSKVTPKSYSGINTKTVFKLKDIVDNISNTA